VGKLRVLEGAIYSTRGNIVRNLPVQLLTKFIPLPLPLFLRKYSNVLHHNDVTGRGLLHKILAHKSIDSNIPFPLKLYLKFANC